MKISVLKLREAVVDLLLTKYSKEDSYRICDVILFAELSGKTSHGLIRLIGSDTSVMNAIPSKGVEIINKTNYAKLINGNDNCGVLALTIGSEESIKIANDNGFAIIGTNNTHTTSGYLSYYSRKLADAGLISIIMARSDTSIAAFDSKKPLLGTNPIAFGFPGLNEDLIFDMGTSAISFGEIIKAKAEGKQLPEGLCYDSEGNPTTDPIKVINDGSILPFDKGYKGSGLAMIVEILAGLFVGAGFGKNDEHNWGNLIIAFKPDLFISTEQFKQNITSFISYLESNSATRTPGKNSHKKYLENIKSGEVYIDDKYFDLLNLKN